MLHIPWDVPEEVELRTDEIARKVQAYTAVADMSPEDFRRLIDGPRLPPDTGSLVPTIQPRSAQHIPVRFAYDISPVEYATYPPVQLSFDFYRDWRLYRP